MMFKEKKLEKKDEMKERKKRNQIKLIKKLLAIVFIEEYFSGWGDSLKQKICKRQSAYARNIQLTK